jgi:hypothetical protein
VVNRSIFCEGIFWPAARLSTSSRKRTTKVSSMSSRMAYPATWLRRTLRDQPAASNMRLRAGKMLTTASAQSTGKERRLDEFQAQHSPASVPLENRASHGAAYAHVLWHGGYFNERLTIYRCPWCNRFHVVAPQKSLQPEAEIIVNKENQICLPTVP